MGSEGGTDLSENLIPLGARAPVPVWPRVLARLIDAGTVLAVLWALVVVRVLWFMDAASDALAPEPWGRGFVVTLCFVVLSALYEVVFLVWNKGQTPGKDIMGIRVVRRDGGEHIALVRALARWSPVGIVPFLRPLWLAASVVVVIVLPAIGTARRALTDVVAGTAVVPYERDREDPAARRPMSRSRRRQVAASLPSDTGTDTLGTRGGSRDLVAR